jgi:biotin carboxyl carrier protein
MKKFDFSINGNKYEVLIKELEDEMGIIEVNGTPYEVEIHREVKKIKTPKLVRQEVVRKPGEGRIMKKESAGGFPVVAPLPGCILSILVKEGATVAKGEVLCTVEAMKMENSVLAEKGGTVKSIKVKVGDVVLQNDVLLVIE